MAVTNWKSVGESIHQGDMDRARLALDARRVAMAEQAQQFNQQRQMHQDAEAKRIGERAYKDSREDLKYNRDFAERDYADRRADTQYNRAFAERGYQDQRGDAQYSRAFAERGYQDQRSDRQYEAESAERAYYDGRGDLQYNRNIAERAYQDQRADTAFSQMIQQDLHNQQTALFNQRQAEFAEFNKVKEQEKLARSASVASLLSYAFTHGDRDQHGNILVQPDAIQVFNKGLGLDANNPSALGGAMVMINDTMGNPLNVPQVLLFDRTGKPEAMNSDVLKGLVASYPGMLNAAENGLPGEYAKLFVDGLGLAPKVDPQAQQLQQAVQPQQAQPGYDKELAKYLRSRVEDASKRISAGLNSVREGAGEEDRTALKYWQAKEDLFYKNGGRMPTKEEVEAYLNPNKGGNGGNAVKDIDLGGYNPVDPLGARTRSIRTSN